MLDTSDFDVQFQSKQRRDRQRRLFIGIICEAFICFLAVVILLKGPAFYARWNYTPREGDIVFQSLNHSPLVNAIEGVTQSPFSHCGIVFRQRGEFYVCEALNGVEITPLQIFLKRGRRAGFAVYRFREEQRSNIPEIISHTKSFLGRPYDVRYRMDDEEIYCSELIYKAYTLANPDKTLGDLITLGEMNWQPYQQTISRFEQGPVPLDRQMITPVALAQAEELSLHRAFQIRTP